MMRQRGGKTASSASTAEPTGGGGSKQYNNNGSSSSATGPKKKASSSTASTGGAAVGFVFVLLLITIGIVCYTSGESPESIRRRIIKAPQPQLVLQASVDHFTPTPEEYKRTFWVEQKKINEPITRAFRTRKWTKVNDYRAAQFVWIYSPESDFWSDLEPWQRTNHIPGFHHWNSKQGFVKGFKQYEAKEPTVYAFYNPDTYRLSEEHERQQFQHTLVHEGGLAQPWVLKAGDVNQGKGITILAPNSEELRTVLEENEMDPDSDLVVQKYVCNELTWDQRKYDVRMFWIIASIDPLVVLYHDGYVRIGNSVYNEGDFSNTRNHLTTHTRLAEEGKATFSQFEQHVRDHNRAAGLGISDPVSHVRNQFKQAIGETVAAFKDKSFTTKKMVEENGMAFYGADFILDQDLDVYFLEPQMGCGLDEDYNFRVQMHDQMFTTMVDVLDEILVKQEKGENLLPLKNIGLWQVVYADGWVFRYDGYKRSKDKKGCTNFVDPNKKKKHAISKDEDDESEEPR